MMHARSWWSHRLREAAAHRLLNARRFAIPVRGSVAAIVSSFRTASSSWSFLMRHLFERRRELFVKLAVVNPRAADREVLFHDEGDREEVIAGLDDVVVLAR